MKPEPSHVSPPTQVPWPPILFAGALVGALALGRWLPLAWPGIDDLAARVVGLGFGAAGLLIMGWAVWTLFKERTNILPNKGADKLVTRGPYARFRNPIYLGDAMILLGLAQVTHNIWFAILSAAFVVTVTKLAVLPEERHLAHKFGDTYHEYVERTRRWI